jgi:hypothetical protein
LAALQNPDEFEELDDDFIVLANASADIPHNDYDYDYENNNNNNNEDAGGGDSSPYPHIHHNHYHENVTSLEPFDDVDSTIKQPVSSHLVNDVIMTNHHLGNNTSSSNVKINEENSQLLSNSTDHFTRQRNTLLEEQFFVVCLLCLTLQLFTV